MFAANTAASAALSVGSRKNFAQRAERARNFARIRMTADLPIAGFSYRFRNLRITPAHYYK